MIARLWHGWTLPQQADAYERLLLEEILPAIAGRDIAGYRGAHLMRRPAGGEVEFITLLWFDGLEAVRAFAGSDHETAVVPPRARALLSRFDARSEHFETVVAPPGVRPSGMDG